MSFPSSSTALPPDAVLLACLGCAKAKAKCEKQFPCGRCVKRNIPCRTRVTKRGPGRSSGGTRHSKAQKPPHAKSTELVPLPRSDIQHQDTYRERRVDHLDSNTSLGGSLDASTVLQEYFRDMTNESNYYDWGMDLSTPHNNNPIDTVASPRAAYVMSPQPSETVAIEHFPMPDLMVACDNTTISSPNAYDTKLNEPILALEGWSLFQCNPTVPSSSCPVTARVHLKELYAIIHSPDIGVDEWCLTAYEVAIEPLLSTTRDKLMAVVQDFSKRALRIHGLEGGSRHESCSVNEPLAYRVLILPAPYKLESVLRACLSCYQPYYPLLSAASLKTNELLEENKNSILASMKLLLMIAAGTLVVGVGRTSLIAYGLIEICRIALSDLIREDIKLVSSLEFLHCAFLFIHIAVWCGDKWLMDVAIFHKASYLEMLAKAGFLGRNVTPILMVASPNELDNSWREWKCQEAANRVAYSWVILDQEMCLFQDTPSYLFASSVKFEANVPSPDDLWSASSAKQWMRHLQQSRAYKPCSASLMEYIERFIEAEVIDTLFGLSPITLHLLLGYLQHLISLIRLDISRIALGGKSLKRGRSTPMILISVRLDETRDLLQKWHTLAKGNSASETDSTTAAMMVMYHFIVLNTLLNFPEVERMARGEDNARTSKPFRWKQPHHFEDSRQIYIHCGQILRIIRSMSVHKRPTWWAGAVYRVALITWANSMSCESDQGDSMGDMEKGFLALDSLLPDDPRISQYLDGHQGIPIFTDPCGDNVTLDVPGTILRHYIKILGPDPRGMFVKGIQQKLLNMAERWKEEGE